MSNGTGVRKQGWDTFSGARVTIDHWLLQLRGLILGEVLRLTRLRRGRRD